MKKFFFLLTLINFACLSSKRHEKSKSFEEYEAGKNFYFGMTLKLFSDSTYKYHSWAHNGSITTDFGKWKNIDSKFYLNSLKTNTKTQLGKSKKLLFKNTQFERYNDTLIISSYDTITQKHLVYHRIN